MTRYLHLRWLVPVAGLATVVVMALSAAPSAATIVCPSGITPPNPYCTDVLPTANTHDAGGVRGHSAILFGVAGPNVSGGDITQYFFEWGTTEAYGNQTPTGTIGSCPDGIMPPSPYCNVPKTEKVSAQISNLAICTTYHFQLVAFNNDGTAMGGDRTFTTPSSFPLKDVTAPHKVKAGQDFDVHFILHDVATVKIVIRNKQGQAVVTRDLGTLGGGKYTRTITAPTQKGKYTLQVIATQSCGQQEFSSPLKVQQASKSHGTHKSHHRTHKSHHRTHKSHHRTHKAH
jgi:hypothetical protein